MLENGIVSDFCCVASRNASACTGLLRGTAAVPGDATNGTLCAVIGA